MEESILDRSTEIAISFEDALGGCTHDFIYEGSNIQVRVPAGVQHGQKLRLKGKGARDNETVGDLYVRIIISELISGAMVPGIEKCEAPSIPEPLTSGSGAGPFGLKMGIRVADLESEMAEVAPFKYQTSKVPKGHSAFESYVLMISPVQGLSWIKAIGQTLRTNAYGEDIRLAFDEMKSKLNRIYGECKTMDFLKVGSIWNESRDWMQGLRNGERYLCAEWSSATTKRSLPNDLSSIFLYANALDTCSGYLAIEYAFTNYEKSRSEVELMEDDAL